MSDTIEQSRSQPEPADESRQPHAEKGSSQGRGSGDAAEVSTESIVEAILLATDSPLPASRIAQFLGTSDAKQVRKMIDALNERYAEHGHAFRIEQIAKGYQILTLPAYNNWLSKLLRARQETRLSGAAMETLAIIAYKQPVLRADIESIRGVATGDIINRLREMNLVKIVGRAEEIGRPMLYGTTKRFLEIFGLSSLDDLPNVEALSSGAAQSPKRDSADDSAANSNSDVTAQADTDSE